MSDELSKRLDAWGRAEVNHMSREAHARVDGAFLRSVRRTRRVRSAARWAAGAGLALLVMGLASWGVWSAMQTPVPAPVRMPEPIPRAIDR